MQKKSGEKEKLICDCIDSYFALHGKAPSQRDIASETNIPLCTVNRYLDYLRAKGAIDYASGLGRSLSTPKTKKFETSQVACAVVGDIACGLPKFAEERIEQYINLPQSFTGQGQFYLLHAKGESMIDAGITDGDLILVRAQDFAERGQIVVALIGEEATLKRYYPEKDGVTLKPANKQMNDIFVKEVVIQGIAQKVIKNIR